MKQTSAPHYYIATIAVLLGIWGVSDYIGASPILAAFVFSIIIANSGPISKIIKLSGIVDTAQLDYFNQEITFILLTIFYVYTGILVNIFDFHALFFALIFVAALVVIRFFEVYAINGVTKWFGSDSMLVATFVHRGPTVIVLLGIVLTSNPAIFSSFGNIIFYTVILAILAGSLSFTAISRKYANSAVSSAANTSIQGENANPKLKQQ